MVEKVWFTLETANQIVGYLGTRPYQEVFQLMGQIQKAVDVQQEEKNAAKIAEQIDDNQAYVTKE
jgi:hypothetical protein